MKDYRAGMLPYQVSSARFMFVSLMMDATSQQISLQLLVDQATRLRTRAGLDDIVPMIQLELER
jgi:hypothetical protein